MRGETYPQSMSIVMKGITFIFFLMLSNALFAGNPHYAIVNEGEGATVCLDQTIFGNNSPDYILNNCMSSGGESAIFTLDDNNWCVSYEGTNVAGLDTACVVLCQLLGRCDTTYFYITTVPTPEILTDTILINTTGQLCNIEFSNVTGNAILFENFCAGSNPENVEFTLDPANMCADYYGAMGGLGRACLRATTPLGSDFKYLDVFVRMPEPEYITVEMEEGETTQICASDLEIFGANQNVESICNGSQFFGHKYNQTENCIDINAIEAGSDLICIVICDDLDICDTIEVEVTVLARQTQSAPELTADEFEVTAGEPNILNLCANDITNAIGDPTIRILSPAEGGFSSSVAFYSFDDSTCELTYEPIPTACAITLVDSLKYELCNEVGCSQAMIRLNITCEEEQTTNEEFQVFSGFSPNGDDKNDNLEIAGLDKYPNHTLSIFNRYGSRLLEMKEYQNDWAGTWDGRDLPEGVYYYMLDTGEGSQHTGWFVIHR